MICILKGFHGQDPIVVVGFLGCLAMFQTVQKTYNNHQLNDTFIEQLKKSHHLQAFVEAEFYP